MATVKVLILEPSGVLWRQEPPARTYRLLIPRIGHTKHALLLVSVKWILLLENQDMDRIFVRLKLCGDSVKIFNK